MSDYILRNRRGNLVIRRFDRRSLVVALTFGVMAGLSLLALFVMDKRGVDFFAALVKSVQDFGIMLFQAAAVRFTIADALYAVLVTLGLAFLTTLLGALIALVLGLLAARNIGSPRLSGFILAFVAFIRAVPTVIWVLVFAIGAGLGPIAAIVGMTFHTAGYLIKAYAESFEEIDASDIEALRACGANKVQIIFQAVLPASFGYLLSWTFIRLEINYTTAVAMGAAAGAGGIGFDLFMASSFYFNIREVGIITWFIFATALVFEVVATHLRSKNKLASMA